MLAVVGLVNIRHRRHVVVDLLNMQRAVVGWGYAFLSILIICTRNLLLNVFVHDDE